MIPAVPSRLHRHERRGLGEHVRFRHGDAVELDYPAESFSHVLGIEGPAHFRTREKFFRSAQLAGAGFEIVAFRAIGDKVFPGYSSSFTRQVRRENRHLGLMISAGFTLVARLLGHLYRRGLIEYVFVRARKAARQ